jgi:hypothetical protein
MNSPVFVNAEPSSALVALVPIVICVAAGPAIGCGKRRWPGADMLVGFGLVGSAVTIMVVATPIPLSWFMIALGVLSIIALAIRRQIPGGGTTWIALVLVSPILIRAAGNQAALYDEFWHWLPSAAYALSHDSLVKLDLAPSLSRFPTYPQAMPLMIAAASRIAGGFSRPPDP